MKPATIDPKMPTTMLPSGPNPAPLTTIPAIQPKLLPEEIERLRRFGEVRRFKAGDLLFVTGERSPGEFLAEVGQLSGRPAFVDARATTNVEALLITPEHLSGVIVAEAELGERIMRALILRRRPPMEAC
jgi:thioredoxin reductase (NADPH)